MFSIGAFARLGAVSIRTLRLYDEIGLLPPAGVDPVTGRRAVHTFLRAHRWPGGHRQRGGAGGRGAGWVAAPFTPRCQRAHDEPWETWMYLDYPAV